MNLTMAMPNKVAVPSQNTVTHKVSRINVSTLLPPAHLVRIHSKFQVMI